MRNKDEFKEIVYEKAEKLMLEKKQKQILHFKIGTVVAISMLVIFFSSQYALQKRRNISNEKGMELSQGNHIASIDIENMFHIPTKNHFEDEETILKIINSLELEKENEIEMNSPIEMNTQTEKQVQNENEEKVEHKNEEKNESHNEKKGYAITIHYIDGTHKTIIQYDYERINELLEELKK